MGYSKKIALELLGEGKVGLVSGGGGWRELYNDVHARAIPKKNCTGIGVGRESRFGSGGGRLRGIIYIDMGDGVCHNFWQILVSESYLFEKFVATFFFWNSLEFNNDYMYLEIFITNYYFQNTI